MMSDPLPRIRAAAYPARVKFRLKGETDGPVYQGQEIVQPCRGCGGVPVRVLEEGRMSEGEQVSRAECGD